MFAGTGRFSFLVYMRMFLPGTISPGTICKASIISSRQSGTECLYDKNCPALAGIPVERTGVPVDFDPVDFDPRSISTSRYGLPSLVDMDSHIYNSRDIYNIDSPICHCSYTTSYV